jgi:hypothetical protein
MGLVREYKFMFGPFIYDELKEIIYSHRKSFQGNNFLKFRHIINLEVHMEGFHRVINEIKLKTLF